MRVKLDAFNTESDCEKREVGTLYNSHIFLILFTFIVIESGHGDEWVGEVTLFEKLFKLNIVDKLAIKGGIVQPRLGLAQS